MLSNNILWFYPHGHMPFLLHSVNTVMEVLASKIKQEKEINGMLYCEIRNRGLPRHFQASMGPKDLTVSPLLSPDLFLSPPTSSISLNSCTPPDSQPKVADPDQLMKFFKQITASHEIQGNPILLLLTRLPPKAPAASLCSWGQPTCAPTQSAVSSLRLWEHVISCLRSHLSLWIYVICSPSSHDVGSQTLLCLQDEGKVDRTHADQGKKRNTITPVVPVFTWYGDLH